MDNLNELLDSLHDAVNNFVDHTTRIIFMNGLDLMKLNMDDYSASMYFISDMNLKNGEAYEVTYKTQKLKLYEFCTNHPDRCFQGTKKIEI